jgi:hypothetical protein
MRSALLSALLLALVAGCRTGGDQAPTPSQTPTRQLLPSPAPTRTTAPAVEPEATTAAPPAAPLSEEGPWLVFHSPEGIWAVNPDGSGLTLVLDRTARGSENASTRYAPSPAGGLLALVEIDDRIAMTPPWLRLLGLPDGQLMEVAQLHPEMGDQEPAEELVDRWAAAGLWNELAWSPDGQWLAFNAVIDGDSGDLYAYSVEQQELSRLTEGTTQAVFPVWSPDGSRIIHGAVERLYFGYSGAGYDYTGVWSAPVGGAEPELLYSTQVNGFEQVLGWLSDTSLLLVTYAPNDLLPCGYHDLRTLDVVSHTVRRLAPGPFGLVAFDPQSGAALLVVPDEPACQQPQSPGIYWLDVRSGNPPLQVVEDQAYELGWSEPAGLFFASTPFGALAVDTAGQFIDLVVPEGTFGLPQVAPGSRRLAWTGDELWIGTLQDSLDQQPRLIHRGYIWDASWSPDGQHLLFMAEQGFFVASEPDFDPVQIIGLSGSQPVWVMPPANE